MHQISLSWSWVLLEQEGRHPLTGQRAVNFRLLANQWAQRRLVTQWRHGCRDMRLSDSASCTVLRAVVLTQYRRVTDGRTDRRTDRRNCRTSYSACNASTARAVKRKSSLFEPPFGRLRGSVRTSSIARWKARVRVPIHHNWTFFATSYCWDVSDFWRGWVTSIAHFRWKGTTPSKHCWVAEN